MKRPTNCPVCQSEELYKEDGKFHGQGVHVFPGLHRPWGPVDVNVYVCGQCGYVMFFLDNDAIVKLKEEWQRVNK